jgi:hypothetical protein
LARDKKTGVTIAFLAAIVIFAGLSFYLRTIHDDAFISFRYAKNLVEGNGLVFNIGERVEGYTNFLWIVLLSPFLAAGLDIIPVSQVLGVIFGGLTMLMIYRFSCRTDRTGGFTCLIAVAFLAVNLSFAYWDSSGLETHFFTFLVLWGVLRKIDEIRDQEKFPASSIILALASMARPEGLLVFGSVLLYETLDRLIRQRRFRPNLKAIGLFLLAFLPYYLWRYAYFGYPLPNTFYAKTGGGINQVRRGLLYTGGFLVMYGILPLLSGFLLLFRKERKSWHMMLVTVVTLYTLYIVFVGGDHMILYRFFVPLIPLIFLLAQEGFRSLPEITRLGRRSVAVIFIALLVLTLLPFGSRHRTKIYGMRDQIDCWIELGNWFGENAEPGEMIALGAAGAIPYYSGLRTIDYYGLVDIHIAHSESKHSGKGYAGHDKGDADYLLALEPDYIIPYPKLVAEPAMTAEDLKIQFRHGPQLDIWNHPEFQENYEVMNAKLESGYVGFFRRRVE